ncbi:MAG TPA: hypothetical protein DCZ95_07045 [Verrucomicrobia bacterium]|nr:MAG: hypothetical protein A2X46_06265 [Lentisphaerae bacterium GWF2_57_35]HBA83832.1 hypothetical protein [Verrucomicrobiota bacterium]
MAVYYNGFERKIENDGFCMQELDGANGYAYTPATPEAIMGVRVKRFFILTWLAAMSSLAPAETLPAPDVSDAVELDAINPLSDWSQTTFAGLSTNRVWNGRLDIFHEWLGDQLDGHVKRVDAFFADEAFSEVSSSSFKLKLYVKIKKDAPAVKATPALDSKLALPNLENKLHVFVDNIAPDQLPGADPTDRKSRLQLGLRTLMPQWGKSSIKLDNGVRWSGEPIAFSSLKWQRRIPLGVWSLDVQEKGYWYSDDGFGEQTQMNWTRWVMPDLGFRSTTAAQWTETSNGLEMEQTLRLGYIIEHGKKGVAFQASVFPQKVAPVYINNSLVNLTYRVLIYRQWLYFEVTPQLEFPYDEDYQATPSIRVGVDMFMGESWLR